jgi:REP element-mobilizing transposase RayT
MRDSHFHRRRLPHWEVPGNTLFVTACLAGSMPAAALLDVRRFNNRLTGITRPADCPASVWRQRCDAVAFRRRDVWLDRIRDGCILGEPRIAKIVQDAILHFHGHRYDVLAYVVMPSHLHWVFQPRREWVEKELSQGEQRSPREVIMHSLLSFTALAVNRALGRSGALWQSESYDRCLRSDQELIQVMQYVENNPVKAGLCRQPEEWAFSSARWRLDLGSRQAGSLPHREST